MQWSDVSKPVPPRQLRQFAGLFLLVFGALAAWRWFGGRPDAWAIGLGVAAVVVGAAGLIYPPAVRPIFTGWMVAAFPIGWTISRLVLSFVFFVVMTPLALVFRLFGRDALYLRRGRRATYWIPKAQPGGPQEYFRQS